VATNGTTAEQTDWHNVVVFNDNLVAIIVSA
jgi:single-stranded DNA-binding protein